MRSTIPECSLHEEYSFLCLKRGQQAYSVETSPKICRYFQLEKGQSAKIRFHSFHQHSKLIRARVLIRKTSLLNCAGMFHLAFLMLSYLILCLHFLFGSEPCISLSPKYRIKVSPVYTERPLLLKEWFHVKHLCLFLINLTRMLGFLQKQGLEIVT